MTSQCGLSSFPLSAYFILLLPRTLELLPLSLKVKWQRTLLGWGPIAVHRGDGAFSLVGSFCSHGMGMLTSAREQVTVSAETAQMANGCTLREGCSMGREREWGEGGYVRRKVRGGTEAQCQESVRHL